MTTPPDHIGCEEALRRLAAFVDRELGTVPREEMEHHLRTCKNCYSRVEFEQRLKEQLSELSPREAPTAATNRIRGLLKGFE